MSCSGACCAAFRLTPDLSECEAEGGERRVEDESRIADMVVPVSDGEAVMRLAAFGGRVEEDAVGGKQWYRCRHWDEGTRLCREYADRPSMCRDYPSYGGGSPCSHCGYEGKTSSSM